MFPAPVTLNPTNETSRLWTRMFIGLDVRILLVGCDGVES